MSKLEELKAVFERAKEEDRIACESGTACTDTLLEFADKAAAMMPDLLRAVAALSKVSEARATQSHEFDTEAWYMEVRKILENLQ